MMMRLTRLSEIFGQKLGSHLGKSVHRSVTPFYVRYIGRTNFRCVSTEQLKSPEMDEIMSVFPELIGDLDNDFNRESLPGVINHYKRAIDHSIQNRIRTRALALVRIYKVVEDPERLTTENIRLATILGWCMELLEISVMIADDIMDKSPLRSSRPTWYAVDGVGMNAIMDSLFIKLFGYHILKKYFSHLPTYIRLVETMHDVTMKVIKGQVMAMATVKGEDGSLDKFTIEKYYTMTMHNCTYFLLDSVFSQAMILANKDDTELREKINNVLVQVGNFIQIENDYLDCYGDPVRVGKPAADIEQGKCTWLIVTALQTASPIQRKILEMNYGRNDTTCVNVVKMLYNELGLPEAFMEYRRDFFKFVRDNNDLLSKYTPYDIVFDTWRKKQNSLEC